MARSSRAVIELASWCLAVITLTDQGRIRRKIDGKAIIEGVERALPETVISKLVTVANDATIDLVDLAEAAILHDDRENFAANTTSAICDDRLILQMIVLTALDLSDKLLRGSYIRNNCILKFTDFGFEGITTIEEDDIVAAFGNQLIDFVWLEVNSAANHAVLINLNLIWIAKCDELFLRLHAKSWEVITSALGPLEIDLTKTRVLLRLLHILLYGRHIATDCAIDAVRGDQDSTFKPKTFTERLLPEHDCLRVSYRGEPVIENDLLQFHESILPSPMQAT